MEFHCNTPDLWFRIGSDKVGQGVIFLAFLYVLECVSFSFVVKGAFHIQRVLFYSEKLTYFPLMNGFEGQQYRKQKG